MNRQLDAVTNSNTNQLSQGSNQVDLNDITRIRGKKRVEDEAVTTTIADVLHRIRRRNQNGEDIGVLNLIDDVDKQLTIRTTIIDSTLADQRNLFMTEEGGSVYREGTSLTAMTLHNKRLAWVELGRVLDGHVDLVQQRIMDSIRL